MDKKTLYFLGTIIVILLLSVVLFLYAQGYNYNRQTQTVEKTGMIVVKSLPDGARIYLNGKLASVSNATLTGLKGGLYNLRLEKDGFATFEKDVPVKEEFVTNLEALLIPLNPELRPLTSSGVQSPVLSESRDRIVFLTADKDRPGIWSLNLTGNPFSLIKGNLDVLVPDQSPAAFSLAEKLFISPNDSQALIQMNARGFYLLDLTQSRVAPQATTSAAPTLGRWAVLEARQKETLSQRYKVPTLLLPIATASATLWSPDERRFLYAQSLGKTLEYHVHDTTDPLGVGEKEDYTLIRLEKTNHTQISWFADSRHLILTTCEQENKDQVCLSGNLRIVRIDGTNNTQIYAGALSSTDVFPTPDGTKIIIVTSFNQISQPNLYAIILR